MRVQLVQTVCRRHGEPWLVCSGVQSGCQCDTSEGAPPDVQRGRGQLGFACARRAVDDSDVVSHGGQ
eukprot:4902172-Pyramimonas_sp.AAC.1